MMNLEGKVAIITGASKGIGFDIARVLGKSGAKVVINSRKEADLQTALVSLKSEDIESSYSAGNVGKVEDIQALVDFTIEKFGQIDILVNNAAANPAFGPLEQTEEWAFDKIMDVNLKGPFELAKRALPHLQKSDNASIINISSVEGIKPGQGLGIYSVSKSALIGLTKSMAKEWGRYNIRTNVICPGLIKTKFSEALWTNDKMLNQFTGHIPIKRIGAVEDVSGLALYLASDASTYTTGGVFTVDGGYTI